MADSSIVIDLDLSAAAFRLADDEFDWKAQDSAEPLPPRWKRWKDSVDEKFYAAQAMLTGTDPLDTLNAVDITASDMLQGTRFDIAGGTALNVDGTDFTIAAGWGSGAAISAGTVVGTASAFSLSLISGSSGTGANPNLTLTFPGGARASQPRFSIPQLTGTQAGEMRHNTVSTTALIIRFIGTPIVDTTYGITCILIG